VGEFQFHTLVDRSGMGSLKDACTPQEIKDAGLVSYWGAEFDFPTCPAFSRGVEQCVKRGFYPFVVQDETYHDRVCWWMEHVRGWTIDPDWIVPTHGTIFSVAMSIRMFVPEGKRMIILRPGYNRYEQAANRLGRSCVYCDMVYDPETVSYHLDLEQLELLMSNPDNTLLVFSNPNNPTGLILSEEELLAIDAMSRRYATPVFSDEIFAEVVRNGKTVIPYGMLVQPDSLAITCTSLGKCMSLTGVNHANVLIKNETLRQRFIDQKYADHYGSIDPMLYCGLLSAYTDEGKAFVDALNQQIAENCRYFAETLEEILPGTHVVGSDATFVAWVDYSRTGLSAAELETLFREALFQGDPGEEYGAEGLFYRYSIAVPPTALERSMTLLKETVQRRFA